jgi:dolichyl-phosphate beta-glucosyltransferase
MNKTNLIRTIVIPAYSEANFISQSLNSLYQFLVSKEWLSTTEVIVVTADASDGTPSIVATQITRFPHHQHILPGRRVGKGRDVRLGLLSSRGQMVVFTDADFATPVHNLVPMFEKLTQQAGMIIGVRDLKTMHKTPLRRFSSLSANILIKWVVGSDIEDSQCGFKGFTREVAREIAGVSVIDNWGFDFEYITIARARGIPVGFLPISDWSDPKDDSQSLTGDSQFGAMKSTLQELMKVRKNVKKGLYKK